MNNQKLEVFTDYVCPWCYLGDSRIKKIKNEFKVDIQLIHFPLHPETPTEGRTLIELFGSNQEDIDQKNERMKELMILENLPYKNRTHTYNSRLAQEIGAWAQSIDNETSIHDNFFEAYFVQGLNVGLESVILDVVSKSGLNPEEARKVIKNRLFMKNIDDDWNKSRNYGVTGVPTYVYQKQSMVGAQPHENLVEFLNHFGIPKR
jgi:predicted DsbA family dithiol-disulfide isomerase|tara:strand:- start:326 stop:940 length:615 start_codon:yes stop_codon:yes gene_type:complete